MAWNDDKIADETQWTQVSTSEGSSLLKGSWEKKLKSLPNYTIIISLISFALSGATDQISKNCFSSNVSMRCRGTFVDLQNTAHNQILLTSLSNYKPTDSEKEPKTTTTTKKNCSDFFSKFNLFILDTWPLMDTHTFQPFLHFCCGLCFIDSSCRDVCPLFADSWDRFPFVWPDGNAAITAYTWLLKVTLA